MTIKSAVFSTLFFISAICFTGCSGTGVDGSTNPDTGGGGNSAPVADAGTLQIVSLGSLVTLNGSKSTDADGDLLTYQWSISSRPNGSSAVLSNPTVIMPTFTADAVGEYIIQLVVNDEKSNSNAAQVTVTANLGNVRPVANAGRDQSIGIRPDQDGPTVVLDGTNSSDANGDPLNYRWKFVSLPLDSSATLSNTEVGRPTFKADKVGLYILGLAVDDGRLTSPQDDITVRAVAINVAPTANAVGPQTVAINSTTQIDGRMSKDANGDSLTYQWTLLKKPDGSKAVFDNPKSPTPTFIAELPGEYQAQLVVNDGKLDSEQPSTVLITATNRPVANAGFNRDAALGIVPLDGSSSTNAVAYQWTVTDPSGNSVSLDPSSEVPKPTFTANALGLYTITLVVRDQNSILSDPPAQATIRVLNAPKAEAGIDRPVSVCVAATLDGTASANAETYHWTLLERPPFSTASLSNSTASAPTFTPDRLGQYKAKLIVHNGELSHEDTVTVTAAAQGDNDSGHKLYHLGPDGIDTPFAPSDPAGFPASQVSSGDCKDCHTAGTHDPNRELTLGTAAPDLQDKSDDLIFKKLNLLDEQSHIGGRVSIDRDQAKVLSCFLANLPTTSGH